MLALEFPPASAVPLVRGLGGSGVGRPTGSTLENSVSVSVSYGSSHYPVHLQQPTVRRHVCILTCFVVFMGYSAISVV